MIKKITSLLVFTFLLSIQSQAQETNILLIIADDLGVDFSNGYQYANLLPTTPTLDSLRGAGITFDNMFSTPKCTPSRATIMSGKHGIKTGVLGTPGNLDLVHKSIFKAIEDETNNSYSDAVIGKWHISQPVNPLHPSQHSIDYYTGLMSASVSDYYAWEHTENGITTIDSTYVTTALTDASINWVNAQTKPWFLWLAHVAPHSPYHVPPNSLYSINATGTNTRKYVAAIEAIDHEIGRLLNNIPQAELDNTIIIFIGDNGTPGNVLQNYPSGHGKGTVYQGGIRVPMIVSGAGVTRQGEREGALIQITDIHATLLEIAGADLPGGVFNSLSFKHLLNNTAGSSRDYNYSELVEGTADIFTMRNERYKLIESNLSGDQQFFDLWTDTLETTDLIPIGLDATQTAIKDDLRAEAIQRRDAWSCFDHIKNGDETDIDCGGTYCGSCETSIEENVNESVKIYPNPTNDEVRISIEEGTYSLKFFDNLGRNFIESTDISTDYSISLKDFPNGIYFLEILNQKTKERTVKKIIRE